MKLMLATTRIASAAAAGYLCVWGFAPSDPEWALNTDRSALRLRFAEMQLPEFNMPAFTLPEVRGPELGRARIGEVEAPGADAEQVIRIAPPFDGLELSDSAIELARAAETLRLEPEPHPAGGWVVGYGRRVMRRPEGSISQAQADAMLREDLARAAQQVRSAVRVSLSEEEYAALVEFARSIDADQLEQNLVVLLLNQGNREMAADAFLIWTNEEVDGVLVQNSELLVQRERTRELFLSSSLSS